MKKFLSAIIASLVMLFSFSSCDWEEINDDTYYTYTCKISKEINENWINTFYPDLQVIGNQKRGLSYYVKDKNNETMFDSKLLVLEDILSNPAGLSFYDVDISDGESFGSIKETLESECGIFEGESDKIKEICKDKSSFNEILVFLKDSSTYDLIYFKMNKKSK